MPDPVGGSSGERRLMTVIRAYGISVSSLDEALAVPKAVRDAWQAYTSAVIQHYEIDAGLRWKLKETHDH
jgi:hypothetical protein